MSCFSILLFFPDAEGSVCKVHKRRNSVHIKLMENSVQSGRMVALQVTPSPRNFLLSDLPYLSLLVLMVAVPFERVKPAFTVLGMELTNLEVVLSAALLLWFIFSVTHRRRLQFQSPITWPSLLLLVVMLLSTWIVAIHPGEALRFCGRFTAGLLIYYFVLNEVTHQSRLLGMLSAAFFTGAFVAVLAARGESRG